MRRAEHSCLTAAPLALLATAAYAHPGDHAPFTLAGLAAHLFEPDHLNLIASAVVAAVFVFRWRRGGAEPRSRK